MERRALSQRIRAVEFESESARLVEGCKAGNARNLYPCSSARSAWCRCEGGVRPTGNKGARIAAPPLGRDVARGIRLVRLAARLRELPWMETMRGSFLVDGGRWGEGLRLREGGMYIA